MQDLVTQRMPCDGKSRCDGKNVANAEAALRGVATKDSVTILDQNNRLDGALDIDRTLKPVNRHAKA